MFIQAVGLTRTAFHEVSVNGMLKAFFRDTDSHTVATIRTAARSQIIIALKRVIKNGLPFAEQPVKSDF